MSRTFIYTLTNTKELAEHISKLSRIPMKNVIRKQFANGEQYYKIDIENRLELMKTNAIIIGSITSDDDLLEIHRVGHYLSQYCQSMVFVIPYMGYATMEREVQPGEVVTAKTNIELLDNIPQCSTRNLFMFFDLHCNTLIRFFDKSSAVEIYLNKLLKEGIQKQTRSMNGFMFGSADLGRPLWVESFAREFGTSMSFVNKHRVFESIKTDDVVIGKVDGSDVIIYDDMIRSGTTLFQAIDCYMKFGAKSVSVVVSHCGAIDESVLVKLVRNENVKFIITTNTHPNSKLIQHPKIMVMDISELVIQQLKCLKLC